MSSLVVFKLHGGSQKNSFKLSEKERSTQSTERRCRHKQLVRNLELRISKRMNVFSSTSEKPCVVAMALVLSSEKDLIKFCSNSLQIVLLKWFTKECICYKEKPITTVPQLIRAALQTTNQSTFVFCFPCFPCSIRSMFSKWRILWRGFARKDAIEKWLYRCCYEWCARTILSVILSYTYWTKREANFWLIKWEAFHKLSQKKIETGCFSKHDSIF